MSREEGDFYRTWNKLKQEKRWKNHESSMKLLHRFSIDYESRNMDVHIIIQNIEEVPIIDFWPTTGKWIVRNNKRKGRGIFPLLKYLGVDLKQEIL